VAQRFIAEGGLPISFQWKGFSRGASKYFQCLIAMSGAAESQFKTYFQFTGPSGAEKRYGQDGSAIFLQLENILKRATEPQEPYAVRAGAGLWVDRRLRVTQSSTAHSANG
jgi:hypothetical protein